MMNRDYTVRAGVIRLERTRQRLSQQRLADRAGLSIGQISRIETGSIETPHFDTIEKLAWALELDADELYDVHLPTP